MSKTFAISGTIVALAITAVVGVLCERDANAQSEVADDAPGRESGGSLFSDRADSQRPLPEGLREISGLAVTADGRLFGHDDETGVIYEIVVETGQVRKSFALGDPVETGDFEGLAITPDDDFYLVTSEGRLLRFREGEDGASVGVERLDTGLDDVCEVEGLDFLSTEQSLLLACKRNQDRSLRDTLSLHSWSIESNELRPWLAAPLDQITIGSRPFAPSAVEVDRDSGRIILLSARGGRMVELDRNGSILAMRLLPASHIQAEGAAIMPDGALVIADEGDEGLALLTRYPRAGG